LTPGSPQFHTTRPCCVFLNPLMLSRMDVGMTRKSKKCSGVNLPYVLPCFPVTLQGKQSQKVYLIWRLWIRFRHWLNFFYYPANEYTRISGCNTSTKHSKAFTSGKKSSLLMMLLRLGQGVQKATSKRRQQNLKRCRWRR
jgi:hypothetical protein